MRTAMDYRDDGYTTFGERWMVEDQIKLRSKIDPGYIALADNGDASDDMLGSYRQNETVICLYVDLDSYIEKSGMTNAELCIVKWLMKGYYLHEIAETQHIERSFAKELFRNAVKKIMAANKRAWHEVCTKRRVESV